MSRLRTLLAPFIMALLGTVLLASLLMCGASLSKLIGIVVTPLLVALTMGGGVARS